MVGRGNIENKNFLFIGGLMKNKILFLFFLALVFSLKIGAMHKASSMNISKQKPNIAKIKKDVKNYSNLISAAKQKFNSDVLKLQKTFEENINTIEMSEYINDMQNLVDGYRNKIKPYVQGLKNALVEVGHQKQELRKKISKKIKQAEIRHEVIRPRALKF